MKLSKEQRQALYLAIIQDAANEAEAGNESTKNDLDARHKFACRYAVSRLLSLANDIREQRGLYKDDE